MPYKTCLNPPFNAIFVESYEDLPKEDNYFMNTFFLYLEFLHYSGLNLPTFVEFYHFGAIRSFNKNDVKFQTLFEKCTMACHTSFSKNHLTFVISSPKFFF